MTDTTFADSYGPWALIAGASMGIGAALSHEAARRGLNVVLLARGKEQLEATAAAVAAEHGVEVRTIATDLAVARHRRRRRRGHERSRGRPVRLQRRRRPERQVHRRRPRPAPAQHRRELPHARDPLPPVRQQDGGPRQGWHRVISSMGGLQGAVNFSTYNAGKAFEWILTESLWTELGDKGVDAHVRVRRGHLVAQLQRLPGDARPRAVQPHRHRRPARSGPQPPHAAEHPGGGRHRGARRHRLRAGHLHPPRRRLRGRPLLLAAPRRGHPRVAPTPGDLVARRPIGSPSEPPPEGRAVDHRQDRQRRGARHGRPPRHRPGRLLRLLRRQGRARRR